MREGDGAPWAVLILVLLAACGAPDPAALHEVHKKGQNPGPASSPGGKPGDSPADSSTAPPPRQPLVSQDRSTSPGDAPPALQKCAGCHASIVTSYLDHGMSRSLGPVGAPEPGVVTNPVSRHRYEIKSGPDGAWLRASFPDGGERLQRLVGRIGAGVFDTSWVGAEVDLETGETTGRLFFVPVETITGHGHELSPFDTLAGSPGLDLGLTANCLTCHTTDPLVELPGAAAAEGGSGNSVFPANALGAHAFEELSPLGCQVCHGSPGLHLEIMGRLEDTSTGLGLVRLSELPAPQRLDICGRCHLQGDARMELVAAGDGLLPQDRPLAGQIPVLVPQRPDDDFRFVGQLERLALAACFKSSPEMTCTTCHAPHTGVRQQGTAAFDAVCADCHGPTKACSRPVELMVEEVSGGAARTAAGCVDCHVRRSQPFDLAHVQSADHYIRRRIPRPEADIAHRQFADPQGAVRIYDDGRLTASFKTDAGRRWQEGVLAMGLVLMGRVSEAAAYFDRFPPAGTGAARRPTAPRDLAPLETSASFHQLRAVVLMSGGRLEEAKAAYSDALELDPLAAGALLARGRIRFDTGDLLGAMQDTQAVMDAYPGAEQPWELRAYMAERLRRPDLARAAFSESTRRWPSNPVSWHKLGLLLRQQGDENRAERALARARRLRPSLRLVTKANPARVDDNRSIR